MFPKTSLVALYYYQAETFVALVTRALRAILYGSLQSETTSAGNSDCSPEEVILSHSTFDIHASHIDGDSLLLKQAPCTSAKHLPRNRRQGHQGAIAEQSSVGGIFAQH